jgi:hypothetical protein
VGKNTFGSTIRFSKFILRKQILELSSTAKSAATWENKNSTAIAVQESPYLTIYIGADIFARYDTGMFWKTTDIEKSLLPERKKIAKLLHSFIDWSEQKQAGRIPDKIKAVLI